MGAEGCHNSNVPPPFLTKTYEMVDDPATDEIVSWSDNNSSFVVWNVADFTKDLLPQYFKHNNFSSFVRQLNTYGFHKIDPDRQEFANEVFCKGNKEALKHIHRRKPAASHTHSLQSQKELPLIGCSDPAHTELEEEIKRLKQDKGLLLSELLQVRQIQQTTETELDELAHRFQALEERQQHILAFMERALLNPSMAEFVQPSGSLAFNKKRRLPAKETFIGIGESWGEDGGQLLRYNLEGVSGGESSYEQPGDVLSNGPRVKSEGVSGAESSYEQILKQFAVSTLNQSDETSPLSRTSGVTPWEMHGPGGEHATNVDSAGNGMATQSTTTSPNEAAECSDSARRRRGCADLQVGSSAHSVNSDYEVDHEEEKPAHVHVKDGTEVSKAGGSNDGFWESMLTENPHLMQKDSESTKKGFLNERWFF